MKVTLPLQVAISKPFNGKDGRRWVKLEGILLGVGIISTILKEEMVPDSIEGKTVTSVFSIGVSKEFKPYLRLVEISDSYENHPDINQHYDVS